MTISVVQPVAAGPAASLRAQPSPPPLWRAPLVPVALLFTAGIVADRHASVPVAGSLVAAAALLIAWYIAKAGRQQGLALAYLWAACASLGAAYHHQHRDGFAQDDIGEFAALDPRTVVVRGSLNSEPSCIPEQKENALRSFPRPGATRTVLRATQLQHRDGWLTVSGLAQLTVSGKLENLHVGDEIEVTGRLYVPSGPANPGEHDYASFLRDQGIRAVISVEESSATVRLLRERWPLTVSGWFARLRDWASNVLRSAVPDHAATAAALLLGDGAVLSQPEWEMYLLSGTLHVLAISGQHLAILSLFLWMALRPLMISRRRGAVIVTAFVLAYCLLVGARPSVVRATVAVCAVCGALMVRRPVQAANALALAWIVVVLLQPTSAFDTGCQVSFLAVAVLFWGTSMIGRRLLGEWAGFYDVTDPMERFIEQSRPRWQRFLRTLLRFVVTTYLVHLVVWLAVTPLLAARFHVVSPVAVLVGPPLVLFTSFALLTGFLTLLGAAVCWPLALVFGWLTSLNLAVCQLLVQTAGQLPGAYSYVSDLPEWWLAAFYTGLLLALTVERLRRHWPWTCGAAAAWLGVLLLVYFMPRPSEFRCTFLAVGHGGCTVIETPDGQTLLYDAGAMSGPEVTRRQIAPYLWHRGIRRIDDLFVSHADLDHFNGLPELLKRFDVRQITWTPTFAQRDTDAVRQAVSDIERRRIPTRVVKAGDNLQVGELTLAVLHPPAQGPAGIENFRSMVLLVRQPGLSILLTGDLEGPGLQRVLELPAVATDVLMAPHHGSRAANVPELADWARPKVVVSCQGQHLARNRINNAYDKSARFLGTWPHGAITLRKDAGATGVPAWIVETFQTGCRWPVN